METQILIPRERRTDLVALLGGCLANTVHLQLLAKMAHWNVRGPEFGELHELFDDVTERLRRQADTLAERAAALGGYVEASPKTLASASALSDFGGEVRDGLELAHELALRLAAHAATLRSALARTSGELAEPGTEHLLAELLLEVEKDIWLLESHVQGLEAEEEVLGEEEEEGAVSEEETRRPPS